MFTLNQINAAHSRLQSGADFPVYVHDLIALGVTRYEIMVHDGHAKFYGTDNHVVRGEAKYSPIDIAGHSDKDAFMASLQLHQTGGSNYPTFCADAAKYGINKWVVDMSDMTCVYYDVNENPILIETIPVPTEDEIKVSAKKGV